MYSGPRLPMVMLVVVGIFSFCGLIYFEYDVRTYPPRIRERFLFNVSEQRHQNSGGQLQTDLVTPEEYEIKLGELQPCSPDIVVAIETLRDDRIRGPRFFSSITDWIDDVKYSCSNLYIIDGDSKRTLTFSYQDTLDFQEKVAKLFRTLREVIWTTKVQSIVSIDDGRVMMYCLANNRSVVELGGFYLGVGPGCDTQKKFNFHQVLLLRKAGIHYLALM